MPPKKGQVKGEPACEELAAEEVKEEENASVDDENEAAEACSAKSERRASSPLSSAGDASEAEGKVKEEIPVTPKRKRQEKEEPSTPSPTKKARAPKSPGTPKASWLTKLPQPSEPPALTTASRQINQEDHLALWFAIISRFNEFKPSSDEGMNKYHWLERKMGRAADDRHKYGWGEYLRGPFMIFAKSLLSWIQSGCPPSGLSVPKGKAEEGWMDWKLVASTIYEEFRPAWADLQKERQLGKDGNERLRMASGGMLKKILSALDG
ncbi:hypothetical protein BCV69DRAFT_84266 [Microstroma glucosiphilum]|uniref:Uncharacterized protein n=1 Tax=Pseudomicrostroma glucosiphilum TaxID=1684307 RepID=A0A316TXZ5_9BASI|nr:hypothetical protein BCV69DRAFT_84266 [Pseudomicrostroma glucosiphilum]PWN18067.1 hypothetical protein BCV69DRAFT_84266 [Pseudomicrostroma glucosiphilum]